MVHGAVQQQAAAVAELGNELGSVADGQQKLMADVSESMVTVTQLHGVAQNVEKGLRDSQAVQQELLESERNVALKLSTLETLHSEHAEAVRRTWKVLIFAATSAMLRCCLQSLYPTVHCQPLFSVQPRLHENSATSHPVT